MTSDSLNIRIIARTFSGNTLELVMQPKETVLHLQHRIAQQLRVPPICISLTVGTDMLQDTGARLADLVTDGSSIVVVIAVISSKPLQDLALNGKPREREAAVDDLLQVADRDHQGTIEVLSQCLEDKVSKVRAAATDALGRIARPGDAGAIAALRMRLEDPNLEVQQGALHALAPLLQWDEHGGAIDVLKVCFQPHNPWPVMVEVVDLIGEFAPQGNTQAVDTLIDCLADRSPMMRCRAISALVKTASCGDEVVVAALCGRSSDTNWEVRAAAVQALGRVAPSAEQAAIEAVQELLDDPEPAVQSEAVAALALWQIPNMICTRASLDDLRMQHERPFELCPPCAA